VIDFSRLGEIDEAEIEIVALGFAFQLGNGSESWQEQAPYRLAIQVANLDLAGDIFQFIQHDMIANHGHALEHNGGRFVHDLVPFRPTWIVEATLKRR